MATIETFLTANSTYELDRENKRIRRVTGVNEPTTNQGADGEWKRYALLEHLATGCVLIHYGDGRATLTSPVRDGLVQS